jgi:hypothetical protein
MSPRMPQLDVVCDLGSFNVDRSWMSWTLDIECVSAMMVEYDISSSFCAYVERPNPGSYASS